MSRSKRGEFTDALLPDTLAASKTELRPAPAALKNEMKSHPGADNQARLAAPCCQSIPEDRILFSKFVSNCRFDQNWRRDLIASEVLVHRNFYVGVEL